MEVETTWVSAALNNSMMGNIGRKALKLSTWACNCLSEVNGTPSLYFVGMPVKII